MTGRIENREFTRRLADRMATDEKTTEAWVEGFIDTLYGSIKDGESVTLKGLGGFYVKSNRRGTWTFRFNPGQRLRALFGWASKYKGEL
jgi:hypothetical protein